MRHPSARVPEILGLLAGAVEDAPGTRLFDGLVATMLRFVVALAAEDRGLTPHVASIRALSRGPAAWPRVLASFRELHAHGGGRLFDPEVYPLLDGPGPLRPTDETLGRILEALAEGSLAALPAEQLGSFYEVALGHAVVSPASPTVALPTRKKAGSPPEDAPFELAEISSWPAGDRARRLRARGAQLSQAGARRLEVATSEAEIARAIAPDSPVVARGGALVLKGHARRKSGSHYTPPALTSVVVERTLSPLVDRLGTDPDPSALLSLRVCDPAMGSGAFLIAACRFLAAALVAAWRRRRSAEGAEGAEARAARLVAERCLYGVDRDPFAVDLARISLWLAVGDADLPLDFAREHLVDGDALADPIPGAEGPGLDAFVGNPPWISFAGRAAQPLDADRRAFFEQRYEAFSGYRNLQGLFIERCARSLAPSGRLGLVIPSSMSEQAGYAPTRVAHDAWCACDEELPDFGNGRFEGVFQPCMVLLSTRRPARRTRVEPARWPIERPDLDPTATALIQRMTSGGTLPHKLFGERGVQTSSADLAHLRSEADARHTVPLRCGADLRAYRRLPPSYYADPSWFGARLRSVPAWREVTVLIRQTARFPIAALSDGLPFRNSILACFEDDAHPRACLVAYLNATPIRWLHYVRHRDARQGMPQVKIGHLRAIPALPDPSFVDALARAGEQLALRNASPGLDEQSAIDEIVAQAFRFTPDERALIARWRARLVPVDP